MQSSVIIGAGWGDEGKGLMTDYLCRKHNADLVIRFNGGGQAGHTVVTPEGKRHVFNHIGSGYFAGAATCLSEHFILNPIIFRKEYETLEIPKSYKIFISMNSPVTTYWDMLANRFLEELRGDKAHGSCGCGINETIERSRFSHLTLNQLSSNDHKFHLAMVREHWYDFLSRIMREFGVEEFPDWVKYAFARSDNVDTKFYNDVNLMLSKAICYYNMDYKDYRYGVFEGAQGLGLDSFYGNYPHVTNSNTGIRNVLELQRNGNYKGGENFEINEIVYVSRTYETRHGIDPDFIEDEELTAKMIDKTNVPNEWQGTLRCRKLSYANLAYRVGLDIRANNIYRNLDPSLCLENIKLAFTHCDQKETEEKTTFLTQLAPDASMFMYTRYKSYGETYKDVIEI
jgi:adenylosuccinate synthase